MCNKHLTTVFIHRNYPIIITSLCGNSSTTELSINISTLLVVIALIVVIRSTLIVASATSVTPKSTSSQLDPAEIVTASLKIVR